LEFVGDVVLKRFRSWDRGEHHREWRALTLLAQHAPGLAPVPLGSALDQVPPLIWMSRLAGRPLAERLEPGQLDAVVAAISRLHTAIPPDMLASLPPQPWLAAGAVSRMQGLAAFPHAPGAESDPVVRAALRGGMRWADRLTEPRPVGIRSVFGQGDGNLANYLWDGEQVQLVDFEDSGRSDRGYELAAFAEHVSVWRDAAIETGALLRRFDLTRQESSRVLFFRRGFALSWLLKLRTAAGRRDGTLRQQAHRLLVVLDRSEPA
jgi:hypothetical protein